MKISEFFAKFREFFDGDNLKRIVVTVLASIGAFLVFYVGSYIAGLFILALTKSDFSALRLGTYWKVVSWYIGQPEVVSTLKWQLIGAGVCGYLIPITAAIALVVAYLSRDTVLLHGAARFASDREVERSGLTTGKDANGKVGKPAILLGKYKSKFLLFAGQEFVILSAPTRGGKGVGVVIPNCLNYIDSLIVLDIKGENFEKTSGYRKAHGQEVYVFQPFSDDEEIEENKTTPVLKSRSHRWNMLSYVSKNPLLRVSDLMDIAFILFADQGNENDFFRGGARSLFVGLGLYLMETEGAAVTVGEIFRYGRGNGTGKPLKQFLNELIAARQGGDNPLSEDCVNALADTIGMPDNTFGSCVSEFKMGLQPWMNPIVDAATAGDDFLLTDVRKKRITIYIVISPNKLQAAASLINTFFSQLVNLNTKQLPEHNPKLKYQCLMLMDEFTAIGKVSIIAKAVSYMAGYNMRLLPIIQSISQLESVYGKEDARTFVVNHAVKIVYPPRDQEDAELCSKELGTYTKKVTSTGTSTPRSMLVAKSGSISDSVNVSDNSRALLMPQELKDMAREDPPRALFFYEKTRAILGHKIRYYLDPVFQKRLLPPIEIPLLDLTRGGRISLDGKPVKAGPVAVPGANPLDLAGVRPSKADIESFQEVLKKKPNGSIEDYVKHGIGQLIDVGLLKVSKVPAAVATPAVATQAIEQASGGAEAPGGLVAQTADGPAQAGSAGAAGEAVAGAVEPAAGVDVALLTSAEHEEELFGIGDDDLGNYFEH